MHCTGLVLAGLGVPGTCEFCKPLPFNRWHPQFQISSTSPGPDTWNLTIYMYAGLLVRWDKWPVKKVSDVPSIIFFFIKSCEILCKNPFNLFSNFFHKITKMKIMSFECPIRNCEKKNTWMSDACSTGCLFHRPNKPAYYIVDCRFSSTAVCTVFGIQRAVKLQRLSDVLGEHH